MKRRCNLKWVLYFLTTACFLLAAPGAAAVSEVFAGTSSETSPGSQADAPPRIGTITYYVIDNTGVHRHTLGGTDTINIDQYNSLILQIPALVSGRANQRGAVAVVRVESNIVTHLLLLKPGKWGTLKTQSPPIRYIIAGTYTLGVVAVGPNGGSTLRTITVNVAPSP